MEVKIGVVYAARELVVETEQSAEDVEKALTKAIEAGGVFTLLDDQKGSRVVVPVDKIAYLEVAKSDDRKVGFGRL